MAHEPEGGRLGDPFFRGVDGGDSCRVELSASGHPTCDVDMKGGLPPSVTKIKITLRVEDADTLDGLAGALVTITDPASGDEILAHGQTDSLGLLEVEIPTGVVVDAFATTPLYNAATINIPTPVDGNTYTISLDKKFGIGSSLTFTGEEGIYEATISLGNQLGYITFEFDARGIPDRFEILDADTLEVLADSLFVGDSLAVGTANQIKATVSLDRYVWNGTTFVLTEAGVAVAFTDDDIASYSASDNRAGGSVGNQIGVLAGFPTDTAKASDGNVKLRIVRLSLAEMKNILIRATGTDSGTIWDLKGITAP